MCERSIHGVCERVIKRELRELARDQTQTQVLLLMLEKDYNRPYYIGMRESSCDIIDDSVW